MHCKCSNVYLLKKKIENGNFHLTIEADDTLHDMADDSRDIYQQLYFNGFLEKRDKSILPCSYIYDILNYNTKRYMFFIMFNWSFDSISSKSLLNGVTDVLPRGPKLLSATMKKNDI